MRLENEVLDETSRVWVCERGHIDDRHYSNPGNELCSRCGGATVERSVGQVVRDLFLCQGDLERTRDDYRTLLCAHPGLQLEALQEYLSSSVDGQRSIDAARLLLKEKNAA